MNLTQQDKQQLENLRITPKMIQDQVSKINSGPKTMPLQRACTIGDGIKVFSNTEKENLINTYPDLVSKKTISQFTPASGAATRMFKHLYNPEENPELVSEFIDSITQFAFYEELKRKLPFINEATNDEIIEKVLDAQGLDYGRLPKALIAFHKYENNVRNSIAEQLVEGVNYISVNGIAKFHFTISPEHEEQVKNHLATVKEVFELEYATKFEFSFSTQLKSSDTVSVTETQEVLRNDAGELVFRPGGHGALIHNLNAMNSDVIFIKNIDNISKETLHAEVIDNKKILGAYLVQTQSRIFGFLKELENDDLSAERMVEISDALKSEFNIISGSSRTELFSALNKPIRVCGMVKNEGKAGGGPFWVNDTVQIVESAQMDSTLPEIKKMLSNATHFNPVDVVCGIKDYRGEKFELLDFIDDETFFVSNKTFGEKKIKVLEHPGLWNGAMANWNTIFVEVPVSTFHPVKTVNDLLQPSHQV